jgi:hypothetical protein
VVSTVAALAVATVVIIESFMVEDDIKTIGLDMVMIVFIDVLE